ncbi:flavin reductase family protein [Azospirillum thermophilum]|uniref:Flavin reductase like domain-containing protein n=1 Tax=Azospirillum thermophilum TaxID=2202148 RepID=A0A2S2CYD7_9PROT|nr:flavin reductase family protein [Azospirillum thermophilum]AWK89534.1 hypothetical protein DEW08_26295 [Azospirillum thermophilum]
MTSLDPKDFRRALGRFPTGVAVMTTRTPDGRCVGMTANSFSSVSLDPAMVLWSVARRAPSFDAFVGADAFAINILAAGQEHLSQQFARPSDDKFAGVEWTPGHGGAPVIAGCTAVFECSVSATYPGGDHEIILGRVQRYRWDDTEPLVFAAGAYARIAPLLSAA